MIEIIHGTPEIVELIQKTPKIRSGEFLIQVIKMTLPGKKFIFVETEANHFTIECDKIPSLIFVLFNILFPDSKISYLTLNGPFELIKTSNEHFDKMNHTHFPTPESFSCFAHELFNLKFRIFSRPSYVLIETDQLHPAFLEQFAQRILQPVFLELGELREHLAPAENLQ